MKHLIESLNSRVRKIRNNPDMAPTHLALTISEIADGFDRINDRLLRLESWQAEQDKQDAQRKEWAIGAMVPVNYRPPIIHVGLTSEEHRRLTEEIQAHFAKGQQLGELGRGMLPPSEAGDCK